ncbi:MAG: tRNA 2-thiouridine(34) synthase MnmA [candidate division FCPU426 bacterium]
MAVALSGGVDSTAAARQLLAEGHEVFGLTMQLCPDLSELAPTSRTQARAQAGLPEHGCSQCVAPRPDGYGTIPRGLPTVGFASPCACVDGVEAAKRLGVEHHLLDLRPEFEARVIGPFVAGFSRGLTPNPCALCNREIKFGLLLDRARDLGADGLATGHYACLENGPDRPRVLRALDETKDQTYFLSLVPHARFEQVRFPLCRQRKRELTASAGQATSTEICFLREHAYADFLHQRAPGAFVPGDIVDLEGRVLGEHQGLPHYTIGQRRGLGVAAPHPLYVVSLDPGRNRVIVGPDEALWTRTLRVGRVNWLAEPDRAAREDEEMDVMIRYRQRPVPARVRRQGDADCLVSFSQPVRAVTPGQVAAFYRGGRLLGGGEIVAEETGKTHG